MTENGIFEVRKGHYSKSYRFQDINYTTTTEGEQLSIIERYCKLLNSLDVEFKITLNNKNKDMQKLRKNVFLKERQDGYDEYRGMYNHIVEEKIQEGKQGIAQERYLTITIERGNFEEAKAQFCNNRSVAAEGVSGAGKPDCALKR